MNEALINLLIAIIGVVAAAITAYVIPWIKSRTTAEKWDQLIYYTTLAVRFANQTMTPEQWQEKKQCVTAYMNYILETKLHLNVNERDMDLIIEGIVNEVKEAAKGN